MCEIIRALIANGKFIPSKAFLDLKLTGLLDDMMKESMHISLTVAIDTTSPEIFLKVTDKYDKPDQKYGIHIHLGEGSINKSGTSAGIAISLLIYSMFNNKKIKNDFAVTGEAEDLIGSCGEIGALDIKIISGIKSGIKNFIFPKENEKDFIKLLDVYKETNVLDGIQFYPITNIKEAIDLIME
jgi:ATP-dependent Lon protease